jgi:adenine-specific DNA-methyltransferase
MTSPAMKRLTAADPATRSADTITENVVRLRALFPELITEGANGTSVNLDVLKTLVGDAVVTDCDEHYGLHWHGKRHARQLALMPSTGTLRPCPDDSAAWETTHNVVIEGDNLEVLKLLQKSYARKVKLIYIDPPYNTGNDFVYRDRFQDNIRNYLELTGQLDGRTSITSNSDASGRFHTNWLNMLYPRLKAARSLLTDDGLIFVSIDDNEEATLRVLLDEVFGEENRLSTLIWHLGTGPTAGHFLRSHETIVCYARDKAAVPNFVWRGGGDIVASALKRISAANPASDIEFPAGVEIEGGGDHHFPNELGGTITQSVVRGTFEFRNGKLRAPVTLRAGWAMKTQIESWVQGKETFDTQGQKVSRFFFSRTGMLQYQKERGVVRPRSVLLDIASTADGSADIEKLGLPRLLFSFPKPVNLIRALVNWVTDPTANDVVLDFFAGSGTTGHAVMAQNASDGGDRRFILVQLPERLSADNKEQEFAAKFCDSLNKPRTIAELTKERLRRASAAVHAENPMFAGDLGFRVFKLDSSNVRVWEPDRSNIDQSLFEHQEHLKPDRTQSDIIFELLLKFGLDLCVPIEIRQIAGKDVHSIGGGVLLACLAEKIARDEAEPLAQGIVAWHQALTSAGDTTCVFRDSAFADDVAKTNMAAVLEQHGIANVRSL